MVLWQHIAFLVLTDAHERIHLLIDDHHLASRKLFAYRHLLTELIRQFHHDATGDETIFGVGISTGEGSWRTKCEEVVAHLAGG